MKLKIYQIDEARDKNKVKFSKFEDLASNQGTSEIDSQIYNEVYDGEADIKDLNEVFEKFNKHDVPLYRGGLLGISDIIETNGCKYYYNGFDEFKEVNFDESQTHKEDLWRIIYVQPGKDAVVTEMAQDLESIQRAVEGYYEHIYLDDKTVILCNDEGKLKSMQGNRRYNGGKNIIVGPFVIIGIGEEDYESLSDEQIEKYMQMFGKAEEISDDETMSDMGMAYIG